MKFKNTFFLNGEIEISTIFADFQQNSHIFKKFSGNEFKT